MIDLAAALVVFGIAALFLYHGAVFPRWLSLVLMLVTGIAFAAALAPWILGAAGPIIIGVTFVLLLLPFTVGLSLLRYGGERA